MLAVVTSFFLAQTVSAAIFYQQVDKGSCPSPDKHLIRAYSQDGKSYYCASGLQQSDGVSVLPDFCPLDDPVADFTPFGTFCLNGPRNNWTIRSDPDDLKFAKSDCSGDNISATAPEGSEQHCGILKYLQIIINILSGLVGIVVVVAIISGGIQYSMGGDDPQKIQAARSRITNALMALILFTFMYAFLQWLVPGGIF